MILSALLTSVGINLGLCLLFFALYSVLRKQPWNASFYAPRLVAGDDSRRIAGDFNIEWLLPTAGWVRRAWQPSDDEFAVTLGLDATRIFVFSVRVFSVGCLIGIFVLLPINFLGNQLSYDFSDLPNKSLESFSISNVENGSNWLWVHFCAAYVFTAAVCYFLYIEYRYISSKRVEHFYSSQPSPRQFTVLVRGIPVSSERSYSESVERFFTEFHASDYLSHVVVRRNSKLQGLISDTEKMYKKIAHLKFTSQSEGRFRRDGCLGLFGRKVDLVDKYEKKLDTLEDDVRMEPSSNAKEVSAAFVSFKTRLGAAVALHIQQGVNPTEWVTERAPEPKDVYWPFFSSSFLKRWLCKLIVVIACIGLTILFLIPVAIVQGLTHLDQLETWFPFLKGVLDLTVVSQVIIGYLPSLILQYFLSFVPPIMIVFSSIQGYISHSQIEKSACNKVLWFTIWNIFFANVLSGSALYKANIFLDPKNIPTVLADAVPAQAAFFIAYVVTSGWTSLSSELCRLTPLFFFYARRVFLGNDDDELELLSISYHSKIPRVLFFVLLGVTFFFLAPLILPFILVYFFVGYIIYRNQLLNVYSPKYETGGKFWPIVHTSTIFSLVLMHIIAIGLFGLKRLPLASSLIVPLPILTLLFNEYCRQRFLSIFQAFPVECLGKKDRDDQNNPVMADFYEKLVTSYEDPALVLKRNSKTTDDRNTPLLQASEI